MLEPERFLLSLIDYEKTGGMVRSLAPFRTAMKKLGNPEREVRNPLLVAGTKGKGSVAMHIAKGLQNAGYRVGLFTSPHLETFRERIRVNGRCISERALGVILERVSRNLPGRGIRTVFQALTATAFMYFVEEGVDFGVFEVGLGGRLDSTNVLRQRVTAFTRIGYDHTRILGKTLRSIAYEKSGVIKNRNPIFSVRQSHPASLVLRRRAAFFGAPLWFLEEDIPFRLIGASLHGSIFSIKFGGREYAIETPAPGLFQVENAALASLILLSLGLAQIDFSGLSIPGRFEIVKKDPWVVLDGAHNPLSLHSLLMSVQALMDPERIHIVLGMNRDKPIRKVLKLLRGKLASLRTTQASSPRAMPAKALREVARTLGFEAVQAFGNPERALEDALEKAEPQDTILVTGSFYLVGELRSKLNSGTKD